MSTMAAPPVPQHTDRKLPHKIKIEYKPAPKLQDGDLLFRYLPEGDPDWGSKFLWKKLYEEIVSAQSRQDVWRGVWIDALSDKDSYRRAWSMSVDEHIVHVGIYASGRVVEIGQYGVYANPVEDRVHFDIVVRFKSLGNEIARTASLVDAYNQSIQIYPIFEVIHLGPLGTGDSKLSNRPGLAVKADYAELDKRLKVSGVGNTVEPPRCATGGFIPPCAESRLKEADKSITKWGFGLSRYLYSRAVICSHFAAAILYVARDPKTRTVETATSEEFDWIFKMSPSNLLLKAYKGEDLCEGAKVVGMQHKGRMLGETDLGKLISKGKEFCDELSGVKS